MPFEPTMKNTGGVMMFWAAVLSCTLFMPADIRAEEAPAVLIEAETENRDETVKQYDFKTLHVNDDVLYNQYNFPVTGEVRDYYPNGKLLEKSQYTDGVRDGLSLLLFPDGTVLSEAPYVKGNPHGTVKLFYANGNRLAEVEYRSGKPVSGVCFTYIGMKIELDEKQLDEFNTGGKLPCAR